MTTPIRRYDRASLETQVFEVARDLLHELGSAQYTSVRGSARLDSDLGLGSLERVELFVRLRRTFDATLRESVITEASTLDDVVAALEEVQGGAAARPLTALPAPGLHIQPLEKGDSGVAPSQSEFARSALSAAQTWQEVILYRAQADAGRVHLILWEDEELQRITFGELHADAQAVAAGLARRGIVPGDAVALMLPTCREFFTTFAGVLLAGGIPVPIYPPVRADRIAEYAQRQSAILRNAEARLLVTFEEATRVAKLLKPSVKSLRGVVTAAALLESFSEGGADETERTPGAASPRASVRAGTNDLALLQYTSGSTGDPKGVMMTHANLLANVRAIGEALDIRPDDVAVSWLPLYHDMGLIGLWLLPLYFGLSVVMLSPLSFLTRPERWLWAFHRYRGSFTAAPNFAYELAVSKVEDSDIKGLDLSSLRAALNGAEPVNANTLDRFAARYARYGFRREALMPVYGLAEASLAVCIPPLDRGPRVDRLVRETFAREGRAVPATPDSPSDPSQKPSQKDDPEVLSFVSVGHPLQKLEVRIVDTAGQQVGDHAEGELWFRGPSATSGYFRNPDATQALLPQGKAAGWIRSGDRAYRVDGEIFITGRVKEIILKAGRNLYPQEIEEITGRVAGVRKGCVVAFGSADEAAGTERLVVVAETRERRGEAWKRIAAGITEAVSSEIGLPPDVVKILPPHAIPKTSSGKLRRRETRRLYLTGTLGVAAPPAWRQVARLAIASGAHTAGKALRRTVEMLYGIYALFVFGFCIVPTWVAVSLSPNRVAAARAASLGLRTLLAIAGCRVHVQGQENLAALRTARVFASNHASNFDVLAVTAALGADYDFHFVAKSELRTMFFFGTFLRKLEHFAFDRGDPQARLRQADEIENALRRGESVFMFPEGTVRREPGVLPFQLGAFKAAASVGCPIVPVAIRGTRRFLPDGAYLPRPSYITLTICPPIEPVIGPIIGPDVEHQGASRTPEWQEVVRLRDAARQTISRAADEPAV